MFRSVLLILGAGLFLVSCAPTTKPLYSWAKYDDAAFAYLKKNDEKATLALLEEYKNIIEKQTGSRQVPPPGICADYGFLLIQAGKSQEGKAMLEKEISLYPESKVFVERILKLMEK